MNDAHLHLLVNHFPIMGTIFGLGILVFGFLLKNTTLKNTAYCMFIIATISGAASMNTGEGAEEIAENLPNVTHHIIHEHEEAAERFMLVLYALGGLSVLGLILTIKKHALDAIVSIFVLLVGIVGLYFAKQTGTTGGEIRHTEIRENTTIPTEDKD